MILMAFLSIAFVYLTDDLQTSFSLMFLTDESKFYINSATAKLLSSSSNSNAYYEDNVHMIQFCKGGPQTAFAGCFIIILGVFCMMIHTGNRTGLYLI